MDIWIHECKTNNFAVRVQSNPGFAALAASYDYLLDGLLPLRPIERNWDFGSYFL